MFKNFLSLTIILLQLIFFVPQAGAVTNNSFVSVVNPVRGLDFWDLKDQLPEEAVLGELEIIKKNNISATWLLRFDALKRSQIINSLKADPNQEPGLFLEVTPSWTKEAGVNYVESVFWHNAASVFLTGYSPRDREKLIDTAFSEFKNQFGFYPKSVGAWWVDSFSLQFMQKKYGISASLIVADQYSTDNYQIWGQYFSTPYYPAKNNNLQPAQKIEEKVPVVMVQWAARDPVNAYGSGVQDSTLSVQANDYIDYHNLDINYFTKLVDIFTSQKFNYFNHLVVGLENSYSWSKYHDEYQKQIGLLNTKKNQGQFSVLNMKEFAGWYANKFPGISPEQIIIASDPLGSDQKSVWYMNPYYRVAWFYDKVGSSIKDIRQYILTPEICLSNKCQSLNFATGATRVLDDVSFSHKWVVDQGKIRDFSVNKLADKYVISYVNEAGSRRSIEFLKRDLGVDGNIKSIDTSILNATANDLQKPPEKSNLFPNTNITFLQIIIFLWGFIRFTIFICLTIFLPGFLVSKKYLKVNHVFLAISLGFVFWTFVSLIMGVLKVWWLGYIYVAVIIFLTFKDRLIKKPAGWQLDKISITAAIIILLGTFFQVIPVFKSGLEFSGGMAFWGPNSHDGLWHVALANRLLKGLPVENPVFSGVILQNYHYFYDYLLATTSFYTKIPIIDLLFRLFPILFSLLLGMGGYSLIVSLSKKRIAGIFSLYLIYFAGSFGWIVEFIRERHWNGESAFWANQAISFNLNPPFAISLILIIALFHLLISLNTSSKKSVIFISVLLLSSLLGFKAYGAILALGSLFLIALLKIFKGDFIYLIIFVCSSILTLVFMLPQYNLTQLVAALSSGFFSFSPFWFVHSMIDSPDRVGWERISLMRMAALSSKNWLKLGVSESIGLALFIVGNLGIRTVSLPMLVKFKNFSQDSAGQFILIFSALSILIPLLFIQKGTPWNTIQFFYYALYITAVFAGVSIYWLINLKPKILAKTIAAVLLILAPINCLAVANGYFAPQPHSFISNRELDGLKFLLKQPDGVVLTVPYDKNIKRQLSQPLPLFAYETTSYVSALSQKSEFVADEIQNDILGSDYTKRLVAETDFFNRVARTNFLTENRIKYIYLLKKLNNGLDEGRLNIKNIYENSEVIIYQVL